VKGVFQRFYLFTTRTAFMTFGTNINRMFPPFFLASLAWGIESIRTLLIAKKEFRGSRMPIVVFWTHRAVFERGTILG
jgi:hypothetical protein